MKSEPALLTAFIGAIIGLALAFGLKLTDLQMQSISTLIMLGGALFTRQNVYSPNTIANMAGTLKAAAAAAKRTRKP